MTSFSTLHSKIEALGRLVTKDSISPTYLSSLLDEMIDQMESIDMSFLTDDIRKSISSASEALDKANDAVKHSSDASEQSSLALENAQNALAQADSAIQFAAEALSKAAEALSAVNEQWESIGKPGGIAPLDDMGYIPARCIPGQFDDTKIFACRGVASACKEVVTGASIHSSDDPGCSVFYDTDRKRFLLAVPEVAEADDVAEEISQPRPPRPLATCIAYTDWADSSLFGSYDGSTGVIPAADKAFISRLECNTAVWSGDDLVVTGTNLALGKTNKTAFPGDEGATLKQRMDSAEQSLGEDEKRITHLEECVATDEEDIAVLQSDLSQTISNLDALHIRPFDGFCSKEDFDTMQEAGESGIWFVKSDSATDEAEDAPPLPQSISGMFYACGSGGAYPLDDYVTSHKSPSGAIRKSLNSDFKFSCAGDIYYVIGDALYKPVSPTDLDLLAQYINDRKADRASLSNVLAVDPMVPFEMPDTPEYRRLFVDLWNQACDKYGQYNAQTGLFELNGLTDITYEEALLIYQFSHTEPVNNLEKLYFACLGISVLTNRLRTLLPIRCRHNENILNHCFTNCSPLTVVSFLPSNNSALALAAGEANGAFYGCTGLTAILTPIKMPYASDIVSAFTGCFVLEHVELSVRGSVNLQGSPLLSLHSVQYLVANAANTSAITITVHPDVYAKLTGDTTVAVVAALSPEELAAWQQVFTDAMNKQITFTTTD